MRPVLLLEYRIEMYMYMYKVSLFHMQHSNLYIHTHVHCMYVKQIMGIYMYVENSIKLIVFALFFIRVSL